MSRASFKPSFKFDRVQFLNAFLNTAFVLDYFPLYNLYLKTFSTCSAKKTEKVCFLREKADNRLRK